MSDFEDGFKELGRKADAFMRRAAKASGEAAEAMRSARAAKATATQAAPPPSAYLPVRDHPKGTRLEAQTAETVTLRFRAAIRFWWKAAFLMIPLCLGAPFAGGYLGIASATAEAQRLYNEGVYSPPNIGAAIVQGVLFATIAMIVATVIVFRLTRPWVVLYADRNHIRVGKFRFDRRHYGSLRLGYHIETSEGMLKNDFHDLDIGLQGLRLVYGPWGEDLPYLVNRYHANEIVLWLNFKIAETAAPPEAPIAQSGQRRQSFE